MQFKTWLYALSCLTCLLGNVQASKPNIIFIMADDLGWADVGFNGAKFYETPHLDQLAADGMIFDRFYTGGANCSPTRACLMTGMYTPRHKIYQPSGKSKGETALMRFLVPSKTKPDIKPGFEILNQLPASTVSLAEVLKPQGYQTAMLGKWHLGDDEPQGFDLFSADGSDRPFKKHYGNTTVADRLTDRAVQFIKENQEGPFFLYLSHWDVHTPIRAQEEVVAKYEAKLQSQDWEHKWNTRYAGMIEAVDNSVGRVRAAVDSSGIAENTLIIFTSDNGVFGPVHSGPLKGEKGSFNEGGIRVATAMYWPGVIEPGSRCRIPVTSVDMMPTFTELAGADLPNTQPVDGRSIVPLMRGETILSHRSIFWHYPLYLVANGKNAVQPINGTKHLYWRAVPSSVIMQGDWKLILNYESGTTELYNLKKDISETKDLTHSHPEKAQVLRHELEAWVQATEAPIPLILNKKFNAQYLAP